PFLQFRRALSRFAIRHAGSNCKRQAPPASSEESSASACDTDGFVSYLWRSVYLPCALPCARRPERSRSLRRIALPNRRGLSREVFLPVLPPAGCCPCLSTRR